MTTSIIISSLYKKATTELFSADSVAFISPFLTALEDVVYSGFSFET